MDERWDAVLNQFYGIVMAFAYPDEFRRPTQKDCLNALDTYDDVRRQTRNEREAGHGSHD